MDHLIHHANVGKTLFIDYRHTDTDRELRPFDLNLTFSGPRHGLII